MSYRNNDCRIYVGNLPPDIRSKELDDLFYKFGKIRSIDIKDVRLPPFAFIEFDDPRDAEDAVHSRDGYDFDGYRLRVEFPKGSTLWRRSPPRRRRSPPRARRSPPRRSKYGVRVTGLPPTGSWQDLKDHMKEAGEVCYADVYRDGTGVVEFLHYDDMKYAVKHLDDSKFRSHENEVAYIRVKQAYRDSRSRSRSLTRSRSKSHSRRRSYTKSKSRSRSRSKSRSKERSRTKDRSVSKDRHSRDRSRPRIRSKSKDRSRSKERSRSHLKSKSRERSVSKSRSITPEKSRASSEKSPRPNSPPSN